MLRFCFLAMVMFCMTMFVDIATAQKKTATVGKIRGKVIDLTPDQNPIQGVRVKIVNSGNEKEYSTVTNKEGEYEFKGLPAGRYIISISKDGYGDRVGKSKVLAEGGEIFDRIKMQRKSSILTFTKDIIGVYIIAYFLFFLPVNAGG